MNSGKDGLRVAILGCGFMGTALLKGLLQGSKSTSRTQLQFAACVQSSDSVNRLQASLGEHAPQVSLGSGNEFAVEIAREANVVILGVRPGDLEALLETPNLPQALNGRIIVSMLAGISLKMLSKALARKGVTQETTSILRLIPTIGAQNGDSVSLLADTGPYANPESVEIVREIFSQVGSVLDIPEDLINHGVAVGATCHALSLVAVDAITDAGVAEGLPRPIAASLARQSLRSAIGVLEAGTSVEQLKAALSTPKGITLNSVVQYERGGVRGGIAENAQSAIKYACEM